MDLQFTFAVIIKGNHLKRFQAKCKMQQQNTDENGWSRNELEYYEVVNIFLYIDFGYTQVRQPVQCFM